MWDWAQPTSRRSDAAGTDEREPTRNANGLVYGAIQTSDILAVLNPRDLKQKLVDRKGAEATNTWHTGRNAHPIYYLDFGDLALLIQSHWEHFKGLLPTQSWALSRLSDAERSRNVIAHTNLLSDEEVVRLEMHVRDWVRQVR